MGDFLRVDDRRGDELLALVEAAAGLEAQFRERRLPAMLDGRRVGLWWDVPGFRNRVAFELGVDLLAHGLFAGLSIVAIPIGFVISHVLIAAVYYLVLTPIALVFRVTGRDVIGKQLDRSAASYWHVREGKRPAASYFKLY